MNKVVALISLVVTLSLMNWSIAEKESHLKEGRVVYLQLAPVDPRSLMQGDYMALNFELSAKIYQALPKVEESRRWRHDVDASDGFVVVALDKDNVASYVRLFDDGELRAHEMLLFYRVRNGAVKFATNAFFFQEGDAEIYEDAEYGQFAVNNAGEPLLVAMYDEKLNRLGGD